MLYYLFRYLESIGFPLSHVWTYVSFRSLLAFILALIINAWFGAFFIKKMKQLKLTEVQRDEKLDPFGVKKIGVPSMGGVIIIMSILIPTLLFGRLRNIYMILMIITTVWLGLLGFADDYIKVFKKNKEGLRPIYKIVGQVALGLLVGFTLFLNPDAKINENIEMTNKAQEVQIIHKSASVKSTITTIPFLKNNNLDYSEVFSFLGEYKEVAGWILMVLVTVFFITAISNGSNLNDGMDGMAAGNSAIIGVTLAILAYFSSHIAYASYFDIMYIPGSQELVIFIAAFVGALLGFLWYNAFPAQIFMGDTGSLTIGGIIAVIAIIIHKEFLLPILCGIFFLESLSVIIQTQYFRWFKRKGLRCRVFKRTPIHDSFRTLPENLDATSTYVFKNWPKTVLHEAKITLRFWIITIILAALTIITLKLR